MSDALSEQIGGQHYKNFVIQPIEFIQKNNLSFGQGNIIKYICRYKNKNGAEDLKKIKHYIDLLLQFEYGISNSNEIETKDNAIYIAGPMRGYANNNFHEFFKWESILGVYEWKVYNPAKVTYELKEKFKMEEDQITYDMLLNQDKKIIENNCGCLFMLEGWDHSEGAGQEYALACELGLKIYYESSGVIPKPEIGAVK